MKTGAIRYNVRERGRQHRGQNRNFDTAALAAIVNSPEVQERVKNRDLVGYFGHWPRVMFGMNPGEGGVHDGKQITLEPALITTMLRADDAGNIEHEAEFLDTAPGRTAKRLFSSKTGGFSSAINCREYAGRDVAIGFHGFDYVMEPNFTTNRGYALDGVADAGDLVLDDAVRETQATVRVLDGLYCALQADYDRMCEAYARSTAECAELVDMLAKRGGAADPPAALTLERLDSTSLARISPTARLDGAYLVRTAAAFQTLDLPGFESPKPTAEESSITRQLGGVIDAMLQRFR
jgi:hypothetical protein